MLPRTQRQQAISPIRVIRLTLQDCLQMKNRVLERVRSVPPGRVTPYGDLGPGAPRAAGAVLAACSDPSVPWQRIVRADGSLPKGERQRALLEAEGVPFKGQRVDMRRAWVPV